MSYYAGRIAVATPAAADNILHIKASATTRGGLCEFEISSDATPVEQSGEYQVVRTTTTGTTPVSGNTTIVKLNSFSPAAGCTFDGCAGYSGAEPTVGDVVMDISVHQKATFRWVAYPGREIWSTPAASAGVGFVVVGQSAVFSLNASCTWLE
jgi:hypothetical protein